MSALLPCPCGNPSTYADCCAPLHSGARLAETPEELMRSRYSAFALGDADHLFRTWHPRTRPADVVLDDDTTWIGLEIVEAVDDVVEFRAHHTEHGRRGTLHERSRFARRAGRWLYLDGVIS